MKPDDKPLPCEPPKHRYDTDGRGRIVSDKCRCGERKLKKMQSSALSNRMGGGFASDD